MTDLKPDVGVGQWVGRILEDMIKTFKAFLVFALLLVDYPKAKQDLIRFIKI